MLLSELFFVLLAETPYQTLLQIPYNFTNALSLDCIKTISIATHTIKYSEYQKKVLKIKKFLLN